MNLVLWIITMMGLIMAMYIISYKSKECFEDVLPITISGMIILLYILGFIKGMFILPVVGTCILLVGSLYLYKKYKLDKNAFLIEVKEFFNLNMLFSCVFIVFIAILTSKHIATWWDDLNYWATDAKALYYLNGFPGKYGNVAPEFGDYPPGIQIFKWCFLKLSGTYYEGLSYSGYYVMMVVYLLPLLKCTKEKNIFFRISGLVLLFLFPAVCNIIWTEGACADVVMGIVFGDLLIAICDNKNHKTNFYYGRIILYLSIVLLCKSSGFQWGLYALVLLLGIYLLEKKTNELYKNKKYLLITILSGAIVQFSWWGYCLINRRIAKLTSSGIHLASNGYSLPDNTKAKAKLFFEGFLFHPAHTNKSIGIDLSMALIVVIILVAVALLIIFNKLNKKRGLLLLAYILIVGISVYFAIFMAHISIFQGETQYETADVMAISISRYASPFTIGMLMLTMYIIVNKLSTNMAIIICAGFILLTTNYQSVGQVLFGYHESVDSEIKKRNEVIDDNGYDYINKASGLKELYGHRVLYLRDNNTIHWIKDTYINYYVSPVPTVYDGFDPLTYSTQDIIDMVNKNHAEYLYVDPHKEKANQIFDSLVNDEVFNYGTIYKVILKDKDISLQKIGG